MRKTRLIIFFTPVWNWAQWVFSGRRLMLIGGVMLLFLALGRVFGRYPVSWSELWQGGAQQQTKLEQISVGEQVLSVEVVRTPAAIEQGLSDRSQIGSDGMLFLLPRQSAPSFWMLRMQFALDIIWLSDGKIVQIDADVPPPVQTNGVPTVVHPRQSVNAVLEVPAGTAKTANWTVGTAWSML